MSIRKANRLFALALLAALPLQGGAVDIVLDKTNLVQNVKQVKQAIDQLTQLKKQVETAAQQFNKAKEQLDALKGGRGMGKLVTDVSRDYIPTNWRETLDQMGSSGNQLKSMVDDIRKSAGDIGSLNLKGAPSSTIDLAEKSAKRDLEAAARANTLYDRANGRFDELQKLGNKIDSAEDPKAIMDLMARLQLETNMLLNEMLRVQAEQMAYARQTEVEGKQREINAHRRAMSGF